MARKLVKDYAAETDLISIWVYSFKQWGEVQADRYLSALENGIHTISRHPEAGKDRTRLREGYWSQRIEHHAVFYTFDDNEVTDHPQSGWLWEAPHRGAFT